MEEFANNLQQHRQLFPFSEFDKSLQSQWSILTEKVFEIENVLLGYSIELDITNDLILSFKMLMELFKIKLSDCKIVDCFAKGGSIAIISSIFKFRHVLSIEISKENHSNAISARKYITNSNLLESNTIIKFVEGSMQDYFPIDYDIYFLNLVDNNCIDDLDEGVIFKLFLHLFDKTLPGTKIVCFTKYLMLSSKICRSIGILNLVCLYHKSKKDLNDSFLWILQKV